MTTATPESAAPPPAKPRKLTRDELGAQVVVGMHRLAKQSTLYASDNEAQIRALKMTQHAVLTFGRALATNPQIYFTDKSVFVGGRLLRAGRTVYDAALEFGKLLKQFDIDEVAIGYDVSIDDLQKFQQTIRDALRREGPPPNQVRFERIRMRKGKGLKRNDELKPEELVVRVYATATVVMRRFLDRIQQGNYEGAGVVRRVAQQLADLGAVRAAGFLGKTAVFNVKHDHAGRAVNSALVAMGMARQITDDKRLLARIAMATLLYDVGRPWVAGTGPTGEGRTGMALPRLGEEQFAELPAGTAAVSWALGGFKPANLLHTVLVYESLSLSHRGYAEPAYGGFRNPSLPARIISTARRFTELLADPDREHSADGAVRELIRSAHDDADRTALQLLLAALVFFPTGSMVELSTGEMGQVVSIPDNPLYTSLPSVRLVLDSQGGRLSTPRDVDLAQRAESGQPVTITRLVELGDGEQVRASRPAPALSSAPPPLSNPAPAARPPAAQPPPAAADSSPEEDVRTALFGRDPFAAAGAHGTPGAVGSAIEDPESLDLPPEFAAAVTQPRSPSPPAAQVASFELAVEPPSSQRPPQRPAQRPAQPTPQPASPPSPAPPPAPTPSAPQPHPTPQPASQPTPAPPSAPEPHPTPQPASQPAPLPHPTPQSRPSQPTPTPSQPTSTSAARQSYSAAEPSRPSAPSHADALEAASAAADEDILDAAFDSLFADDDDDQDAPTPPSARAPQTPDDDDRNETNPRMAAVSEDDEARRATNPKMASVGEDDEGRRITNPKMAAVSAPERAPIATPIPAERAPIATPIPAERAPIATPIPAERAPIATPIPAERAPIATPIPAERQASVSPTPTAAREDKPTPSPNSMDGMRSKIAGVKPKAQGKLSKTPLVHLLVYSLDQRLSGTTVLRTTDGRSHLLYFEDGAPSKVRTSGMVEPLDRVLVEMGVLDASTLQQTLLAISKSGMLHGEYLLSQGMIDEPTLKAALSRQLAKKIAFLLKLPPDTQYAYYDGINLIDGYGGDELTPAEPLEIIMMGVRLLGGHPLVAKTLSRLGHTPLRLARQADVSRLGLRDDEQQLIDVLRSRPTTLQELIERNIAEERVVQLTVYALVASRCLNLGGKKPPVGHNRPRVVVPKVTVKPADEQSPRRQRGSTGRGAPGQPVRRLSQPAVRRISQPAVRRVDPANVRRVGAARSSPVVEDESASAPPTSSPTPSPSPSSAPSSPKNPMRAGGSSMFGGQQPSPHAKAERALRRGASTGRGDVPRRGSTTGRALPRRGSATGRNQPLPRRGASTGRGAIDQARGSGGLSREEIAEHTHALDERNHFEILGLGQDADESAIQSKYFKLAKKWHPDRLPEDMVDLRGKVAKIFARMNEAYQTLNDAAKRSEYLELVKSGGGTAKDREMVEKVIDSALVFQKGEVFFRKGNLKQAEHLVRQAVEADPEQPEYRALLAWIQGQRKGTPKPGEKKTFLKEQLEILDAVIKQEPEYERALYYRAELLKRSGDSDASIKDFKKVAKLNPRNIDAVREVRLYDMRKGKAKTPGGKPSGLFGRFFGKDED